ncbi:ankyrin repeat and fibronectin type-III domain-containing protein 1 isoform X2 [Exaiptasia diaphana]|uniref:Fibronectin type-III domain-containing protein n=1 Tax=Exaiptasia diaphana TaxID=2652724 RepID=A0A913XBD7_EXADI|nr:ankyrin repeat and fibronectin type-III domain-containing protein 1 isoform X2 [Exaiptasia diaphana]
MAGKPHSTTDFLESVSEDSSTRELDEVFGSSKQASSDLCSKSRTVSEKDVILDIQKQKELEKPHPLRSPVRSRPPLLRAFTISSIPVEGNQSQVKNGRHMFKAPLKLKFSLSTKSAAWRLEDDHEAPVHSYLDEGPIGYTPGGLYFMNSIGSGTLTRKISTRLLNGSNTDAESSKHSSSSEGSDLSINSRKTSGIVKLARKLSQRRERKTQSTPERVQVRSQSLENIPSPTDESSVTGNNNMGSIKSPGLYRTMSLNHRPSPRPRLTSLENRFSGSNRENRFSGSNRDLKEKTRKRKENSIDSLIDSVVCQDIDDVRTILETEDLDVNKLNAEGFAPLDFAVLLGFYDIAKLLQAYGAQESPRLQSSFFEKHLKMLINEAEHKVEDLTLSVVHATNSNSSEIKETERQLKEWEWTRLTLRRMLIGLNNSDLPGQPVSVTLSVASEDSLLVRFTEPINNEAIFTKYKIQWSRNENFIPLEGEYVLTDVRNLEYTIPNLQKSVLYFVRVSCGNLKGFGTWLGSTPPSSMPSSWHEVDDSKPRFQGRLSVIDNLFSRVWMSHERHPTSSDSKRPRSGNYDSVNVNEGSMSPKSSRKESVKKSLSKYTNIFFQSTPKFIKNMKRGVYLAAIMYTSDDRVLVTFDDSIPTIEVDDNYPPTFLQDFCWLMKIACTWKDVKRIKQEVEKNPASTSVLFRCKLLNAVDAFQTALGKQNLGQLHYKAVKDRNGSTVIVTVNCLNHASAFRPRIMALKWTSLIKLQKKASFPINLPADLCYASDMLITSIKEKVEYFQQSRKSLERGMYIGYLKLRTFVDAIHVVVNETCPNVLPHVKIRDNPNVSREEWQWLQSMDTLGERTYEPTKTAHDFQLLVARAAEILMEEVGVSKEASKLHRIYDREVVELDENVSFLIVFPPPEDVCSAPGQVDTLTHRKKYISLPVQTFEMIHMCTYQSDFISHYSRLSSVLDMDSVLAQQSLREAFSSGEIEKAKQRQVQLMEFQRELDETWKGMRWILDALHYARDRQVRGGIPLVEVFKFSACHMRKTGSSGSNSTSHNTPNNCQ